jgi:hypothetical protein
MLIAKQPKSMNELLTGIKQLPKPIRKWKVTHLKKDELKGIPKGVLPNMSQNEDVVLIVITFPKQ